MLLEVASVADAEPITAVEDERELTSDSADLPFVLVVSDYPPAKGGVGLSSCIILARLFEGYPADRIAYVSLACHTQLDNVPAFIPRERMHTIRSFPKTLPSSFPLSRLAQSINLGELGQRINTRLHGYFCSQIRELAARYKADIIFSCPLQDGDLFRASVTVCREERIPLAAYFLDDWASAHRNGPNAEAATRWQAEAMQTAAQLYFIGPGMQEAYREKYGVESEMLIQVVDLEKFYWRPMDYDGTRPLRMVFTGTLYGAQEGAFDILLEALDEINDEAEGPQVLLELYSNYSERMLANQGRGRRYITSHGSIPASVVPYALASADVLYLPLSFQPEWRLITSTSVPGKLPEYLASGRPILVHAPQYADICRICREQDAGVVVDDSSPSLLAATIRDLMSDPEGMIRMGSQSRFAARRYDARYVQQGLYKSLTAAAYRERKGRR